MSNQEWFGEIVGRKLDTRPEGHLADLDSHRIATEDRVNNARLYWVERSAADFRPYGRTDRKFTDTTTGELYVLCRIDPFQLDNPRAMRRSIGRDPVRPARVQRQCLMRDGNGVVLERKQDVDQDVDHEDAY